MFINRIFEYMTDKIFPVTLEPSISPKVEMLEAPPSIRHLGHWANTAYTVITKPRLL